MSDKPKPNNSAEQRAKLAAMLCKFLGSTIGGHERGMYKHFLAHRGDSLDMLQDQLVFAPLFGGATVYYFNLAYKSLVLRDDDKYILNCFDRMHAACGHSYICLLNIACAACIEIHGKIDRTRLDVTSLAAYEASVVAQLGPLLVEFQRIVASHFEHQCCGDDISKCDPNKPMFTLGEPTVILKKSE